MSDNWVVQNIQNALDTWNDKLTEIWSLITQSPADFKGGAIWNTIVDIHSALQAVGYALLVLFFLVGVVKTCGSFVEVKKPEHAFKLFIRFALAKGVITYGLELMMALFNIIQGVISSIMTAAGFGSAATTVLPDSIVDTGYNDLATTDPVIAAEWDKEKNKLCVNKVSRNSLYSVWWKCSNGHSWKARIADRAIDNQSCKMCEQEYLSIYPEFLISLYARRNDIKAVLHSDEQTGIEIDVYLPELNLGIDCHGATNAFERNENSIKEHICKQSGIEYLNIPFKGNTNAYAFTIRNLFRRHHIIISTDERSDNETIRKMFIKWKKSY